MSALPELAQKMFDSLELYTRTLVRSYALFIEAGLAPEEAMAEARHTALCVVAMPADAPMPAFGPPEEIEA